MRQLLLVFGILCPAALGGPLAAQTGQTPDDVRRHTSLDIHWRAVSGERESARFQEYRDVPSGPAGSFEQTFHHGRKNYLFQWDRVGQSDQYIGIRGGRQGDYRLELFHDKIPHRFAFDALTLYSGIGTGNLTIPASIRATLQASTSPQDLAARVNAALASDGRLYDIWLNRKTTGTRMDFILSDPVTVHLGWQTERRDGGRPFFGSFGIGSTVEVVEPINYDTTDVNISAEYALKGNYLSAAFHSSRFDNNIGELAWDNPFRLVDSTGPTAYLNTYQAGPARGLLDLYPDNRFTSFTLTGAATQLPARG
ncbi:MAG: MtrB/PioB family outer membrane beta-barrel protein, partial [Armatimonadota bacterium]